MGAVPGPGDRTIRTHIAAALVLAASASSALAWRETHLNEIASPVKVYADARVATLTALPSPTAAEKKELKLLAGLSKKLAKTAFTLKQDFAELAASGAASKKLGAAAAAMQPSLDAAFVRAELSLSERVELVGDHNELLNDPKHLAALQKALAAVSAARNSAAGAATPAKRAAALVKADAAVSKALKSAEKYVVSDRDATLLPPPRYRSGDTIDLSGGRVAVPRDSGSPVAGASIVVPQGVFQTPVAITLAPGVSFVGGRDVPAGPALAIGPDGLALGTGMTVQVPFVLPDGTNAQDLALFAAGPPVAAILPVTVRLDGTLTGSVTALSTFQAGIAAPPVGQPGGAYHMQSFAIRTSLDVTGHDDAGGADLAALAAGVMSQTATFRPDHTASFSAPSFPAVSRTFTRSGAAHHTDEATSPFSGSVDLTWTPAGAGRFTFTLPLGGSAQAAVTGVASDDGRVIAWTGHGGSFDFTGFGVKSDVNAVTADLQGRWAAAEIGIDLLDDAAEPFRTRWHDALRAFTVDAAGAVTFEAQGRRFETDITYHTDQGDPVHTRAENVVADGGSETWTVAGGRIADAATLRSGWLDKAAGVLTITWYDAAAKRVSLMVAVQQPATATPANFAGLYHFAGLDVGTTTGSPTTHSSTHDVTPSSGSLTVPAAGNATLDEDATNQASYALTGTSGMVWTMTQASSAISAASGNFTLTLDAAGNRTGLAEERWYAFEGLGRYVLSVTRGEATRLERGISLGVR